MSAGSKLIGVGSPIIDLLARVDDVFLTTVGGAKGGMELVDPATMDALVASLSVQPAIAAGGSAGNTAFALARAGVSCAFLGKIGSDAQGALYADTFAGLGGDISRFKKTDQAPTARCLSLVTPDSERTMRTDLGAAMLLSPADITPDDFAGFAIAHLEGYLLFNRDLFYAVVDAAKAAGCKVSLDLGSFEVVGAAKDILPDVLKNSVDLVFANEDEAEAYCGTSDTAKALEIFADLCEVAAVKLGADGALLARGTERARVPVVPAPEVVDTTGAGDYWAAGFLYGYLHDQPLATCGHIGALFGSEVVRVLGAKLPDDAWARIESALT